MRHLTTLLAVPLLLLTIHAKAQETLDVNCGTTTTSPDIFYDNTLYLDSNLVTYGIGLGTQPGFLVTVFDTDCQPWDSLPFNATASASSISKSFKFVQDNTTHLLELNDLINNYIPNDHPFVIYTPMTYSGSSMASLSPQLAQTFMNYWGNAAVQTESIMILFGIKGYPNSFEMDTLVAGNQLNFSVEICPHAEQTLSTNVLEKPNTQMVANPNPAMGSMEIQLNDNYELIEVQDLSGRTIKSIPVNSNTIQLDGLDVGQYLLTGIRQGLRSEPLRIQFY